MTAPLRVVFMGTPAFAVPSLKALSARPDLVKILSVYTQPDRPAGRGQKLMAPPIKALAEELGLPVHQPESVNAPDELRRLADFMADVVVVVAYAQFLGNAILNTPRLGCVNVHSSLLPKYRGAAPIQYAIWKGETETGVTTMRLVRKMDAGPILLQKTIPIGPEMTGSELHDRLSELGGGLLVETLEKLRASQLADIAQDESQATYAKLINKADGLVEWNRPGREIINQIRALDPWPGAFGRSTKGTIKILKARFHDGTSGTPENLGPGGIFLGAGSFWVRCADGWIELLTVQPEGRKAMSSQEFLNGLQKSAFAWNLE